MVENKSLIRLQTHKSRMVDLHFDQCRQQMTSLEAAIELICKVQSYEDADQLSYDYCVWSVVHESAQTGRMAGRSILPS